MSDNNRLDNVSLCHMRQQAKSASHNDKSRTACDCRNNYAEGGALTFNHFTRWILIISTGTVVASLIAGCAEATPTDTISTEVLVEYQRSGGLAGFDDLVIIDAARKAVITRKGKSIESVLEQKSFEHIVQQLDQLGFSELEKDYLPADTCCDLIEYTMTYQDQTVRMMDTAVPESLQPILDSLNAVIDTGTKP